MAATHQPLFNALRRRTSSYVCRSCRDRLAQDQTLHLQRRHVSGGLPFTERIRRKIWGTDNPPGLKDPYGGPSFLEKRKMRKEAERQAALEADHGTGVDYAEEIPEAGNRPAEEVPLRYQGRPPMEEYKEAESWDGLEFVGHRGNWKEVEPTQQDMFSPWSRASSTIQTRADVVSALHQAIIECLAVERAELDLDMLSNYQPEANVFQYFADVELAVMQTGKLSEVAVTEGRSTEQLHNIARELRSCLSVAEAQIQESLPVTLAHMGYIVGDEGFLALKLDLGTPFAFMVIKRFSQIIGRRIPDPILHTVTSSSYQNSLARLVDLVFESLIKKEPENLAQALLQNEAITAQSNIRVLPRRETPIDREKDLGRWKIIEEELQRRGLPVTGKLHV